MVRRLFIILKRAPAGRDAEKNRHVVTEDETAEGGKLRDEAVILLKLKGRLSKRTQNEPETIGEQSGRSTEIRWPAFPLSIGAPRPALTSRKSAVNLNSEPHGHLF
jgi:hypothetical protein